MSADVICLRPEADFLEVGVLPPAGLAITYAEPLRVPPQDLATARAVVLASVGPRLERSWLDKIPDLELVQFTGAGVDRVGDACAHRPRVTVAAIPAANAREVAEYVLFSAGVLLRRLAFADRGIRAGQYAATRARMTPRSARSLHSRTAGVVGLGHIGLAVARLLRAVGATVCYADPAPRDAGAAASLGLDRLSLDDLLARCDLVTLHVPLLPSTRGMLGEPQLRRMPPGALLINASRGGVVDEEALTRVLTDGHLGGAAVDVYQAEPPAADSPLLTLPPPVADRVLFTPHIAGVAYEAAQSLYTQAWDNVSHVLMGRA
ncbi:MAG TPA: NAD(P)-dependent oxidoreductase [Streptosporangiaceae bacterium]